MTPEVLVVLTLAGVCLILLYWRTLLELLIVCAVFGGLGLIWSADMPPVWLKGVLTVALLAALGLIAEKLGLRLGERTQTGRRRRSASVGAPDCTRLRQQRLCPLRRLPWLGRRAGQRRPGAWPVRALLFL